MLLNQVSQTQNEESKISTLFIERLPEHDIRLLKIKNYLREAFYIEAASSMRRFTRYEIQGLNVEETWKVNYQVFSTLGLDSVIDPTELLDQKYILPLTSRNFEYDTKAQSALKLLKFYYPYREIFLRSSEILVFTKELSKGQKDLLEQEILPKTDLIISQLKPVTNLAHYFDQPVLVENIKDFLDLTKNNLKALTKKYNLKLSMLELGKLQEIYLKLKRDPSEAELLLFDAVWSAQKEKYAKIPVIDQVRFADKIAPEIKQSHKNFQNINSFGSGRNNNFASSEVNLEISAQLIDNKSQPDSFAELIKSSVIRGSKPIQGMRLTTRDYTNAQSSAKHDLKSKKLIYDRINDASLYAKKSNIPISYVREYYTTGFRDNNWEISALLSQKLEYKAKFSELSEGDIIVILGERTDLAREKILSKSEINALLTRFLLEQKNRSMIKCLTSLDNDSLALNMAKLESGLILNLDVLPLARADLSGVSILLSNTPDRFLAVIESNSRHKFIGAAQANDLEAVVIGKITNDSHLQVNFRGQKIIDLSRNTLIFNTEPIKISPEVNLGNLPVNNVKSISFPNYLKEKLLQKNNASQKDLINRFADHINGSNLLSALGGINQNSPELGMLSKINQKDLSGNNSSQYSIITHATYPELAKYSPYHASYLAVFTSFLQNVALGGNPETVSLKLFYGVPEVSSEQDWGNLYSAKLGAHQAIEDLKIELLEHKTEIKNINSENKDINVPLTISFALNTKEEKKFSTATLSKVGLHAYRLDFKRNNHIFVDKSEIYETLREIHKLINSKDIIHTLVCESELSSCIFQACIGNNIGFNFNPKLSNKDLFSNLYGSLLVFTHKELTNLKISETNLTYMGKTISDQKLIRRNTKISLTQANEVFEKALSDMYNFNSKETKALSKTDQNSKKLSGLSSSTNKENNKSYARPSEKPVVLLPIFKDTVGEEALADKLDIAGAQVERFVFCSSLEEWTERSLRSFSNKIYDADALILPGGYDLNDQPDGVAKLLCLILEKDLVKTAINHLLERNGKILGIGNGFQALIACGLLPYGRYRDWGDKQGYFIDNIDYQVSNRLIDIEVYSNKGNWYENAGDIVQTTLIADYWNLKIPLSLWDYCIDNSLIVTKFKVAQNQFIESMTSPCGNIYGRLTHPEFLADEILNIPNKQDLNFFKRFVNNLLDEKDC